MTAAGNEAETAHPVQEDLTFNFTYHYFIYPLHCRYFFEGYCFIVCFVLAILRCSVLF